jgi:DNA-binding CsgD family transcriptional regulator/tetratricopeptide (TPR) repeat protein
LTTGPTERAALLVVAAETSRPGHRLSDRLAAARSLDQLADWEAVVSVLVPHDGDGRADHLVERDALLGHAYYSLGRVGEARASLDRAATRPVDPGSEAGVRLAWEMAALMVNVDGDIELAIALLNDRITAFEGHADDHPGQLRLRLLRDCVALLAGQAIDIGLLRAGFEGLFAARAFATAADLARVVNIALLVGQGYDPAMAFLHEAVQKFEAAEVSSVALELESELVQVNVLAGRFDDAVTTADEVDERPAPSRARHAAATFRGVALAALGRLDEGDGQLTAIEKTSSADWFGRGELLAARSQVALWGGRADLALELADAAIAIPAPILGGHVLSGLARAWAAFELGLPIEVADGPIRSLAGARPELDGLQHLAAGRNEEAAEAFGEARRLWEGFHAIRAMTCHWAEAEALRRFGSPTATAQLASALAGAEERGFEALALRVRRSLRQAGVRVRARARDARPAQRLTRRERELVDLAGRGLTNLEIARRMGLGRPTVSRIMSSAMGKLGAESRAQAVALATEVE